MSVSIGKLAYECLGEEHPLQVLKSGAGYYIGTFSNEEGPVSRESEEYFRTENQATLALANGSWTQRSEP